MKCHLCTRVIIAPFPLNSNSIRTVGSPQSNRCKLIKIDSKRVRIILIVIDQTLEFVLIMRSGVEGVHRHDTLKSWNWFAVESWLNSNLRPFLFPRASYPWNLASSDFVCSEPAPHQIKTKVYCLILKTFQGTLRKCAFEYTQATQPHTMEWVVANKERISRVRKTINV